MSGPPIAFAVGLIHSPPGASHAERTLARIAVAVAATRRGYALVECYETSGDTTTDDVALQHLKALAIELDADAIICVGAVDRDWVADVAEQVRMLVVHA